MHLFLDADGHFVKDGQHQGTDGIYAERNADFRHGGGVFVDLMQRVGHKPTGDHAQALVDPGSHNDHDAGDHQGCLVLARRRRDREHDAHCHEDHGTPHPGYQGAMAVQTHEQVLDMGGVAGDLAVKGHEDLTQKEKDVNADGVGHSLGQGLNLLFARVEIGKAPDEQAQQDQQSRSGGKGRRQEPGRQDGGEPEVTTRQTAVQVGRDRVNTHRPGDGDVDQRFKPALVVNAIALGLQHVPSDDHVQKQVAVEHDGIVEQHAVGRRVQKNVERPHGLPQVDHDKQQTHDDGGDGQKFTQDGDLTIGLVVMQIVGQHHHHSSGGHADQVGEVGNVKSPGDVPAHTGDTETELELHQVKPEAGTDNTQQDNHPPPVPFISFYG